MKRFCEDEGYDYWKFCKLASEDQKEMEQQKTSLKIKGLARRMLAKCKSDDPNADNGGNLLLPC